jgi:flavin reductase (DIM6/NTAB) family NADH-FMN oxidoreductase RutF
VSEVFESIATSLDNPLVVVTAAYRGHRAGCLVGFHTQTSIDPSRYCVWLSKANHTYLVATSVSHVGVHFLTAADHELAEVFGTRCSQTSDKFAGRTVSSGPGDAPLLEQCAHRIVLRRTALVDCGDHVALVGDIVDACGSEPFVALRLAQITDLDAGHDASTRASSADLRYT